MGLRVNTDVDALFVCNQFKTLDRKRSDSIRRLSTGRRINSAKDDASGLAVANKFRAQISSMRVAYQNAMEAQSMLQVADGGYNRIHDILVRMKDLATQASSGQIEDNNRLKLNTEFESLGSEIDRIARATGYANTPLILPNGATLTFQVGATASSYDQIAVRLSSASLGDLGLGGTLTIDSASSDGAQPSSYPGTGWIQYPNGSKWTGTVTGDWRAIGGGRSAWLGSGIIYDSGTNTTTWQGAGTSTGPDTGSGWSSVSLTGATWDRPPNIATQTDAQTTMGLIDTAMDRINGYMASIGAYQNRLQYTTENLQTSIESLQSSESVIRDADIAVVMTDLTKSQIQSQTAMSMLTQANQASRSILTLIQGGQ